MPRHSQICTVCQHIDENLIVAAGEVRPCYQCGGTTERLWSGTASSVHGDDIPGGMWVENGFEEPIKVYSHSEHERKLAEQGCEIRAMNRGPSDKICQSWDVPCEATLEKARIALSRKPSDPFATADELAENARILAQRPPRWPKATIPITVTEGEKFRIKQERE